MIGSFCNKVYVHMKVHIQKIGLKINIKTEVIFRTNSTKAREDDIIVDEHHIELQEFTCLGSVMATDGHIEADLHNIMS